LTVCVQIYPMLKLGEGPWKNHAIIKFGIDSF
jgi:hypothetical protein